MRHFLLGVVCIFACNHAVEHLRSRSAALVVLDGALSFGNQAVTTVSAPRTVVVRPAPPPNSLQFDRIEAIESTCPEFTVDAPNAAGAVVQRFCTAFGGGGYGGGGEIECVGFADETYSFQVRFAPVLEVPSSGQCRIIVRLDGGSALSIPVSGIGGPPPLRAEFSTRASINFATVNLGTPSTSRSITITNTGSQALTVGADISQAPAAFEITGNAVSHPVAPGAAETYAILCRPPVNDPNGTAYTGSITIMTNDPDAADASVLIPLACIGTDHPIKDTPPTGEIKADVQGTVPIMIELEMIEAANIEGMDLVAPARPGLALVTPTPAGNFAIGDKVQVQLMWTPPDVFDGDLGQVNLKVTNEADRPITIAHGTSTLADVTSDVPATEKLDFGKLCIGESRMRTFNMQPAGNDIMQFSDYTVISATATAPFTASVIPNSTVTVKAPPTLVPVEVTAMPMISDGKFEGTVTLTTSSPTEGTFTVPTIVEVLQGGTTVTPPLLNFRDVIVTGFSETKTAIFSNCSAGDIEVTGVLLDGESAPDFDIIQIMPDGVERLPPFTLPRGGEVAIAVQMLPQSDGTKEAVVSIDYQEPDKSETSSETIALLGEGFFRTPDRDSYYRCSTGAPLHLAPLGLVVGFIVLRRRRRRP